MPHVVHSLFGKPKCSACGGVVKQTGYSFPYPQWRCPNCSAQYERDKEVKAMQNEIAELKRKLKS